MAYLDASEASTLIVKEDQKDAEKIVNLFMETIFREIHRSHIERMVYSFVKGEASCGETLISYDEIPHFIYFIQEGSAKVEALLF